MTEYIAGFIAGALSVWASSEIFNTLYRRSIKYNIASISRHIGYLCNLQVYTFAKSYDQNGSITTEVSFYGRDKDEDSSIS